MAVVIGRIRQAAEQVGRPVAIMADCRGPKFVLVPLRRAIELKIGDPFTLTTEELIGNGSWCL